MGRPALNVLFSQSFEHYHPGEHVNEVRFSEPVVIAACEILELQTPSVCRPVSLTGHTSPLSFAVEIFVRSGGDARFKRLCHAFLYSASAPPLQDVQVAVTDHLVIRGTYDSLTLVLYGNLASDIGQLSDHDLESPLPDLLPNEASHRLEDIPEALHPQRTKVGAPFSPLQYLQLVHIDRENLHVIRKVLQLAGHTGRASLDIKSLPKVIKSLVSAAASLHILESGFPDFPCVELWSKFEKNGIAEGPEYKQGLSLLLAAKKELQELQAQLEEKEDDKTSKEVHLGQELDVMENEPFVKSESSDLVLELILHWIQGSIQLSDLLPPVLFPMESLIGGLAAAQLLCTDAEECYRFVLAGGASLLMDVLQHVVGNFAATTLLALGAVERVARYAFGCEALLGWWGPEASSCGENGGSQVTSKGYSILVNLLLEAQQPSVAHLAARVLQRLRAYELTAAIQGQVEIFVGEATSTERSSYLDKNESKSLAKTTVLIRLLSGLLSTREALAKEGPSSRFSRWFALDGEDVGTLLPPCAAYGAIDSTSSTSAREDVDRFLLSVLQERRLLPLLVALVSAPKFRFLKGDEVHSCAELVGAVEALLLALLSCRSGILFLANDPEVATALLGGLQRLQDSHERDLPPVRHAVALTMAGFVCRSQDIGGMLQTCLSVISALDRLLASSKESEDSLWALWELSSISRFESGRQALLILTWFPEVMTLLIGVFQMGPESCPPVLVFDETWRRAALHFVAEIFQVVIRDTAPQSVAAWTPHAVAMQRTVLASMAHLDGSVESSAGGYEDKDGACSGLLEWLDSAVVYQKKGAVGLLKYVSAILAGGSGPPQTTAGPPVSDGIDAEASTGDQAAVNDIASVAGPFQGKWPGMETSAPPLSDTAMIQMTVSFRILALVSCYPGVAAVLYGEGAMSVVCSILGQCLTTLQTFSSVYDAADEDMEDDLTTEDLVYHGKEHLVLRLLLPTVLFLLALLQNLQTAVQYYQNTRLVDVILGLHQCISSRSASYVSVPPYAWSGITQDFVAVRQVLASVLACWPVFGWTPSLFPRLLGMDNHSTNSSLTLLPMEPALTCSVLSILVDLLPQESPQVWKSKSALLDMYRSLAVGSILGVQSASAISWHTQSPYSDRLLRALVLQLDPIGEVICHHAYTACGVLQDLLKIFIIRLACTNLDHCAKVVRAIVNQIRELGTPGIIGSERETLQVERAIQVVAGLALHPASKRVLLREGAIQVLLNVYTVQCESLRGDVPSSSEADVGFPTVGLFLWIVRAFAALCDPNICMTSVDHVCDGLIKDNKDSPSFGDCCSIVSCLLTLFQLVPIGKEFEVVLDGFEKLSSHKLGRAAVAYVSVQRQHPTSTVDESTQDLAKSGAADNGAIFQSAAVETEEDTEEGRAPIFLDFWRRIRTAVESDKSAGFVLISVIRRFALSMLVLSAAGKSSCGVAALRLLFGLDLGPKTDENYDEGKLEPVVSTATLLRKYIQEDVPSRMSSEDVSCLSSVSAPAIQEAYTALMAMLRILKRTEIGQELTDKSPLDMKVHFATCSALGTSPQLVQFVPCNFSAVVLASSTKQDSDLEKDIGNPDECIFPSEKDSETCLLDSRGKLVWECPSVSLDRPVMARTSSKRKTIATFEVNKKRHALDFSAASTPLADAAPSNVTVLTSTSVRPSLAPAAPASVLSRRDTFRQRKPNTSRPPSMHVDDYVARERSEVSGSSPAPIHRSTSGSGRPPSIHVDEFLARQQERLLSVTSSGMEEQLRLGGGTASLPPIDSNRRDNSQLVPAPGKISEEEGQISSTPQEKVEDLQWEENSVAESAAVEPAICIDMSEPSPPRASAPLEKTPSSSSSISNATDSVQDGKTPQVAAMLLLQSKVTLQTTVARNLAVAAQKQAGEPAQIISNSGTEHLQVGEVSKLMSTTSTFGGSHSLSDKGKPSTPSRSRTSELQSSAMMASGDQSRAQQRTNQQPLTSHQATVLQAILRQSSSMFPVSGTPDSTITRNVFTPSVSEKVGPSQMANELLLPSESLPSSSPVLPGREPNTAMLGLDSQSSVNSMFLARDKRQPLTTSMHSSRQLDEPANRVAQNLYGSQGSTLPPPSPFTALPRHGPQVIQVASPVASRDYRPLTSNLSSDTSMGLGKGVLLSSQATDPRPRPPDTHGEGKGAQVSGVLPPTPPGTPWAPFDASQRKLESTLPASLAGLFSARPSPPYNSVVSHGVPWPHAEVVSKVVPPPEAPTTPWPGLVSSTIYSDDSAVHYGTPGRPVQPPVNPPLPGGHGSTQFPGNLASPRSPPPLTAGNMALENLSGPGVPGSHTSPRERRFSGLVQGFNAMPPGLQPMAYIPPPVPAGRPSTPQVPPVAPNIPPHQQLHVHFQQQNILKLQQQQLQARQQQLQQNVQPQQVQQFQQQHMLGPLPVSLQVPVAPLPPPPPPPPPLPPLPSPQQQRAQQQEPSAMLQQMLASPGAIQALLKDQNKLRELLEQHPKLISLLQEKMSQAPS